LSSSTTKRVVVYRFDREPLRGYVNPQNWLQAEGIELLSPDGTFAYVPQPDVKLVCFVRDFDGNSIFHEKRLYASRPKTPGLWVRAQFRDNDFLEGVMSNDLLGVEPFGFMLVPPDPSSNNQRIFLPRQGLRELRVIGVIGGQRRAKAEPERQIKLFDQD
jgi:hypothetical protein